MRNEGQDLRNTFGTALGEALAEFYRTYYEDVSGFTEVGYVMPLRFHVPVYVN